MTILIADTDGLKRMPEALGAVFPATALKTRIVHLARNSLDYASWKDRKTLASAVHPIYTAASATHKASLQHSFLYLCGEKPQSSRRYPGSVLSVV